MYKHKKASLNVRKIIEYSEIFQKQEPGTPGSDDLPDLDLEKKAEKKKPTGSPRGKGKDEDDQVYHM